MIFMLLAIKQMNSSYHGECAAEPIDNDPDWRSEFKAFLSTKIC